MHKISLKKVLPLSIIAIGVLIVSVVFFIIAPLMTKQPIYLFADTLIAGLKSLFSFAGKKETVFFFGLIGVIIGLLVWLIFIIVRKQPKHLIPFAIVLITSLAAVIISCSLIAGRTPTNGFIFNDLVKSLEATKWQGDLLLPFIFVSISIVAAFISMCICVFAVAIDLIRLCARYETKEVVEEKVEEDTLPDVILEQRENNVVINYSRADLEAIVRREADILYIKLHGQNNVDRHVIREELSMAVRNPDDEYYERMINELGMFKKSKNVAKEEAPVAKKVETPVVKPTPVVAPVVEPVAAPNKIIRIPFEKRIVSADKVMKEHYNDLKSEILAYGAKSRISNSGDTFRLHTVTYVKITIAGKSLKLYLALNPRDYKDSTIPFADASDKGTYKEIPFVFKVKSDLSVRRAKQLIAEAMAKGGLEKGEVVAHDWVKEIAKGNF